MGAPDGEFVTEDLPETEEDWSLLGKAEAVVLDKGEVAVDRTTEPVSLLVLSAFIKLSAKLNGKVVIQTLQKEWGREQWSTERRIGSILAHERQARSSKGSGR